MFVRPSRVSPSRTDSSYLGSRDDTLPNHIVTLIDHIQRKPFPNAFWIYFLEANDNQIAMMLQKTGWRFKQFISHQRNSSNENCNDNFQEPYSMEKRPSTSSRRLSWLSQSPPPEFQNLRRADSNTTTTSQEESKPPVVNNTAHSSSSSLCSCDCALRSISPRGSLLGNEPPPPQIEILYLPSSTHSTGDAETWQRIFTDNASKQEEQVSGNATNKASSKTRDSTFDLLEALELEPLDDDKTPTQSLMNIDDMDADTLSENVEQLIRETDKAFKAVGTALEEARAATQGWYDTESNRHQPRSILRRSSQSPHLFKATIGRSSSGPKLKRKKSKKKRNILGRTIHAVPPPPSNTPSRWTLNEITHSMVEAFSGKLFRTEADEMLTPRRMPRLEDELMTERNGSMESARSSEASECTPTDPFHLESLSTRITAAQHLSSSSAHARHAPVPKIKRRFQGDRLVLRKVQFADQVPPVSNTDSDMTFDQPNLRSPTQSPRGRRNSRGKEVQKPLPTIHEVSDLSLSLESTTFTLTCPLYAHGPIRIEKKGKDSGKASPQGESLDWTAFQMAILGTMDEDEVDLRDDWQWEADEKELDDLVVWFESFGFDGFGAMEGPPPIDFLLQDDEKEVLVQPPTWRSDSGKIVDEGQVNEPSAWTNSFGGQKNLPRLDLEYDGVKPPRKPSLSDSLPPSPMLDLIVGNNLKSSEDLVPMGFNLGHDLGDFLRWEVTNVQALSDNA